MVAPINGQGNNEMRKLIEAFKAIPGMDALMHEALNEVAAEPKTTDAKVEKLMKDLARGLDFESVIKQIDGKVKPMAEAYEAVADRTIKDIVSEMIAKDAERTEKLKAVLSEDGRIEKIAGGMGDFIGAMGQVMSQIGSNIKTAFAENKDFVTEAAAKLLNVVTNSTRTMMDSPMNPLRAGMTLDPEGFVKNFLGKASKSRVPDFSMN